MRYACLALALFVLLAGSVAAQAENRSLVMIQNATPTAIAELHGTDVIVVRDMGTYLLALAGPGGQAELAARNLGWRLLDTDVSGHDYYTVSLRDAAAAWLVAERADLLWRGDRDAVVRATAGQIASVLALGCDVARVFLRPVRPLPVPSRPAELRIEEPDPVVTEIVQAVSGAAIDADVQRFQDFVTRYAEHDSCQAAANFIRAQFLSAGIDSVYFHHYHPVYKDNVVAVIPGTSQPEKTIVIGGHYDSYTSNHNNCPGADDNASGAACVLECARVLAGHPFEYTIKLVAFGGEELGLYGSEGFASDAAAAGEDIVAAVAVDMIGYLASGDVLDLDIIDNSASAWIRDLAFEVGGTYVPELPVVDGSLPFGASSDHASFWANGYEAILLFEDTGSYSPYIHTTSDLVGLSYNSPTLAERSVKLAAGLIATLARPFRVSIAHVPLPDTEDTQNPYRVASTVLAAGTLNPDSLLVYYDAGSGFSPLPLIPAGGEDEYEAFIPAQPAGHFVAYYLLAADTDGQRALHPAGAPAVSHRFFVGTKTVMLAHDFETAQGWTVGAPGDDATTGIWDRVNPNGTWLGDVPVQPEDDHTPEPGVLCYVTGNAGPGADQGANDVDGGRTTLLSPTFDLSGQEHAWVRYYRWYTNDTGNSPGSDTWTVEASADGGTQWVALEATNSSLREWHLVECYLPDYLPLSSQVQFRFVAADEDPGSIVEAGVDDFSLLVYEQNLSALTEPFSGPAAVAVLEQNRPNPFNPRTTIRLEIPAPGRKVDLGIFDVTGRRVASLLEGEMVSGPRAVAWAGLDDRGREVAAGVYFYRLEAGSEVLTRKLLLVR